MITVTTVKCNAAHPELPLNPLVAHKGSASSVRILDVPKKIGEWEIKHVYIKAKYPDGSMATRECVRVGNVWVGTLSSTVAVGRTEGGFSISADGVDEHGEPVDSYILGVGDVEILDADGSVHPGLSGNYVVIYDEQPETPRKGDAYFDGLRLMVYDGNEWQSTGLAIGDNPLDKDGLTREIYIGRRGRSSVTILGEGHVSEVEYNDFGDPIRTLSLDPGSVYVVGADAMIQCGSIIMYSNDNAGEAWMLIGDKRVLTEADVALAIGRGGVVQAAVEADKATADGDGSVISSTYARKGETYTRSEVDDKITRFVAHYLTDKVNGRFVPFATHAALAAAKAAHTEQNPRFFYAGQPFTPTKNDYCVVLADETIDNKTTRYSFVGDWPTGSFQYQYTINDTAFSQAQWDAINSGINSTRLAQLADKTYVDAQIGNVLTEAF